MNRSLTFLTLVLAFSACHSRNSAPVAEPQAVPAEQPAAAPEQNLQRTIESEGFSSKGTIEAITEVPVYSRIAEQIVSFDIELGQRVRKGEVVVRLSQDVLKDIRTSLKIWIILTTGRFLGQTNILPMKIKI
jgi:multidrug efflux pump subunit AcrA (membrane-fusion protein)